MDTLDRDVTGVDREREREHGHTSVNPRTFREPDATTSPCREQQRPVNACNNYTVWHLEEYTENARAAHNSRAKIPLCPRNNKVPGAEGIRQIGRSTPRRSLLGTVSLLARLAVTKGIAERVSNCDPLQRFSSRTSYRVSRFIVE